MKRPISDVEKCRRNMDQNHHGESIFRMRNIHCSAKSVHHIFHIFQAKPAKLGIAFGRYESVIQLTNRIFLRIDDFITEILLIIAGFYRDAPLLRIAERAGGFDGVVQGVGKDGAKVNGIQFRHPVQIDLKKTIDLILHSQIVFGVEHSIHHAVLAKSPGFEKDHLHRLKPAPTFSFPTASG